LDYPVVRVLWSRPPQSRQRREASDRFVRFLHQDDVRSILLHHGFRDQDSATTNPSLKGRPPRLHPSTGPEVENLLDAWEQARKPTRMLLAVDVSRAMSTASRGSDGTQLDAAIAAIKHSLRLIGDRDEIGLWASAQSAANTRGY